MRFHPGIYYTTKYNRIVGTPTELTDILLHGIDLKSRRLYFGTPLDLSSDDEQDFRPATVELAVRILHRLAAEAPKKPIEIHMSSYGGDPYAMLRLHDEILSLPCQVKFFGGGPIMSAATWIMAVCDERYLYPNATVMIHDGSFSTEGKHTDVQISAAEDKRLQDMLYEIYANNSRMPKAFWQEVCQRDLYLTAQEAITLGLADKIVEPKKRGNLRRMRQSALSKKPPAGELKKLVNELYSRINKVKIPKIELNEPIEDPSDPEITIDPEVPPR
jgi:ATP-dependent Clp protease protease subunit